MRALAEHGFPVPDPVETNRHCVLMGLVEAHPLTQVRELAHPAQVWTQALGLMVRLARHGLVHCDFNEFNLLVDEEEELTLIDFPQMVSSNHLNAAHFYQRDVDCLRRFFVRRYNFRPASAGVDDGSGGLAAALGQTSSADASEASGDASSHFEKLDEALRASGYGVKEREALEAVLEEGRMKEREEGSSDGEGGEGSSEDEDEEGSDEEWAEGEHESSEGEAEEEEEEGEEGKGEGELRDALSNLRTEDPAPFPPRAPRPPQPTAEERLREQRSQQRAAAREAAAAAAAGGGEDGDDTASVAEYAESEVGDRSVAGSVSVGLSARQVEIRERIRAERRKAGGGRGGGGVIGKVNHMKDKSGSHKKKANAATDSFWG